MKLGVWVKTAFGCLYCMSSIWTAAMAVAAGLSAWSAEAKGDEAWISFVEDPSAISADPSVINDAPCDPTCQDPGVCQALGSSCGTRCKCACEKDMAVGDLNGDLKDDLVIVRMQPFELQGGASNLLFINENGVMVDRSGLVDGFGDSTQDRDVAIVDVNADIINPQLNMPDVVTGTTYGEQPRVYINLGCCSVACTPASPCAPGNEVQCNSPGANWCGLKYDPAQQRLPVFSPGPLFYGVAAGDINNDGCPDLYFTDYDNTLEDRLLFNGKDAQTGACTGYFTDVTTSPATRLCPNGPPCFYEGVYGTDVDIVDIDLDGNNDIVKGDELDEYDNDTGEIIILYNDDANVGHFNVKQVPQNEPGYESFGAAYTFAAGDMNDDRGVDLYSVRSKWSVADRYLLNECFQADPLPAECDRGDGTVRFAPPRSGPATAKTHYNGGNARMVDLNGDFYDDVLVADTDLYGGWCSNLALQHITVDPGDPFNVTHDDPTGTGNCAWNTPVTYDFALLDIDGDTLLDLWSGHGFGNSLFIQVPFTDCDANGIPDNCAPAGVGQKGGVNPSGACCSQSGCVDGVYRECCDPGCFNPGKTCSSPKLCCPLPE